jgi:lipoprotein-anchoring transpeptidase ErfK/SrfK
MGNRFNFILAGLAFAATACGGDDDDARARASVAEERVGAASYGDPRARLTAEELERGRLDASWRNVVEIDTTDPGDTTANPESWDDISGDAINQTPMYLPVHGDVAGPSVLRVQILLDRAFFSPGVMDGRWGKNTEKAVYWFQRRAGLRGTARVDQETFDTLLGAAGNPEQTVRAHTLTTSDVEGPFVQIPEDIYEQAEMDCSCYESLSEKLGETFHATPELLSQLNGGRDLNGLSAGDRIRVPDVRDDGASPNAQIAKLVVSDGGFYLHALDASDRIIFHFPTTLGSDYSPSPTGDYRVTNTAHDPTWHYQPDILEGIPDDEPDAIIPPGPNNAVGVVWMALSKEHYGIHGTNAPETIGYATSNGCIRLTNWDAAFLANRIDDGVPVEFRDVDNPGGHADAD